MKHRAFFLIAAAVIFSTCCFAGMRGPGKYSGMVVFDRWGGCILYSGNYVMHVSERVKEKLRPYAGYCVEVNATDVYQPMNPGDGLIKDFEYIGQAVGRQPYGVVLDGLQLKSRIACKEGERPAVEMEVFNFGNETVKIDSAELALTLLMKQNRKSKSACSPSDGPSAVLITQNFWIGSNPGGESRWKSKGSRHANAYQWTIGKENALPHTFELKSGEKKRIKISFGVGEGGYEFICSYGGGVHAAKVLASNPIGFDVDEKGAVNYIHLLKQKGKSLFYDEHGCLIPPKSLVKMRFPGAAPLGEIVELYDESTLAGFYEILRDEKSPGYELGLAVNLTGLISKRGNKDSVKELLNFYKRRVDWAKCSGKEHNTDGIIFAKFAALNWIGFIGGDEVEEMLKEALTVTGSRKFAKEWLEGIHPTTFSVVHNLRGHAALGLAFSEKEQVHKLIKNEYKKEKQACLDAGVKYGSYFNLLCDAMARIDIVEDIGLEGHRKLYDGEGSYSNLYQEYIRKYLLFKACPPVKKKP